MIDGWMPYAKCKDTVPRSASTMLLPPFGCYSAYVSGALLSLRQRWGQKRLVGSSLLNADSSDFKL